MARGAKKIPPAFAEAGKKTQWGPNNPPPKSPGRLSIALRSFREFAAQEVKVIRGGEPGTALRIHAWLEKAHNLAMNGDTGMLKFLIGFEDQSKTATMIIQNQLNQQLNVKGDRLETLVNSGRLKLLQEIPDGITEYEEVDEKF